MRAFPPLLALACAACARVVPADRSSASLYRDLQRLVTLRTAAGWEIDRIEVDDLMSAALMSVCRVAPAQRQVLLDWLDGESARHGGPLEEAWRRRGSDLDGLDELIELARIRQVLAAAGERAPADCPFWIEPQASFAGRQISDDRWQLSFGGGGKGILVHQGDRSDFNFGGAGRAVIGRNLGSRSGLYAGVEIGASASFPKGDDGVRGQLQVGLDVVVPVVYRYTLVNTYVEGELGYLARTVEDELGGFEPGVHIGVAFGGRASRQRLWFPGAALALSYERTFPDGDGEPLDAVKLGFRVALDWDW